MKSLQVNNRKVVVIGAGAVGSTFVYALAQSGLANEIILIDKNENLAQGQVLDLAHGQPFFPTVSIRLGNSSDYTDARVIIIAAGSAQNPGDSRLKLIQTNAAVVRDIVEEVLGRNSSAVLLVVSNPVDIMTYAALKYTAWDRRRIIGAGTVLDSARLRHLLSIYCGIDVHNIHGYILGEHGDSEFAAWSMTHVAGMQIDAYCKISNRCNNWKEERNRIEQTVRDSAYHIIDYKGATYFAVGLALVRITGAILRGEKSVLTVSTMLNGEFGIHDVCLSVPCIVSAEGIEKIVESELPEQEILALKKSAATLKQAIEKL